MGLKMRTYGYSTPASEIEDILGLAPGNLRESNLDMDLADDCRLLSDRGVDLNDEAAVREHFARRQLLPYFPARYIDALVVVARSYHEEGR
jgi:hypothetical protein